MGCYSIPHDYVERVYAGWYGKLIGIRHGSNIEGWSCERIAAIHGEITGYLFDFKNFAADDDSNGPIFFIRALSDYTHTEDITAEQMGKTLLNYAPFEHGFFWWGGYGKSTEHTAYLNLQNGIPAPLSGSVELNGADVAEQIGGQIFIDTWGLVIPFRNQNNPIVLIAKRYYKGSWRIWDGALCGSCADRGELYTGGRDFADTALTVELTPIHGEHHLVLLRVQGAMRSYAAGLGPDGRLALLKNVNGLYEALAETALGWTAGNRYTLAFRAEGNRLQVECGGKVLEAVDGSTPYVTGCVGTAVLQGSRCLYHSMRVVTK